MRRNAAPDVFARYDERTAHNAIENIPGFVWCPMNGCGAGQIHDGQDREPIVTCVHCRQSFCFIHRRKWHRGLTCDQVDRNPELEEEGGTTDEEAEVRKQKGKQKMRNGHERTAAESKRSKKEAETAARRIEERLGEAEVKRISKRCPGPGCNWRSEKDNGCKHVTCK